jgi:hypothetical protein
MKISTKGRYALRLMLDLCEHNKDEFVSLKEISERQEISLKYLEQIVSLLGARVCLLAAGVHRVDISLQGMPMNTQSEKFSE